MSGRRNNKERRSIKQRRRLRERQCKANERFAVIEIAGAKLRVAILDRTPGEDPDRVKVDALYWRNEAPSLNTQLGLEELTTALRELAEKQNLWGAHLQFVLGGEFCVTKAMRGSTEEVRSELQQLEQRSRLYLMLGPGEKITVSNTRPIDARHEYAVAAVCNKKTLGTVHQAAANAGLKIDSIEPALVSTSRVIGRLKDAPSEPCLLIHMDQSTVELGICHHGQLLLDYRPGGRTEPQKLIDLVRTHLSRLQRHVGRQLREAPPTLRRVYLCGEDSAVEKAFPGFSSCEQFDVKRIAHAEIQATWDFEKGSEDSASAPALGALLSTYLPSSERNAPNFMEHILASTRVPLRPILLRSAIPLAAVLLVALGLLFLNYREQLAIDGLKEQADRLAVAQARARELHLQITSIDAKLTQMKNLAEKMQAMPAGGVIARIGHCMPSDVWLSKLVIDDMRSVQLSGVSYLEAGVFDFVRWLGQAPGLEDVGLRGTRPGQSPSGPAINFEVELNLGGLNGSVRKVARNE